MYDGNGNRSSVTRNGVASTYSTDSNDKLNFGDGYTFSGYDSNGNPHSIAAGGVTYGLTFDYENQLTQMTYSNGTPTSSFLYNGDNLRVRKTDSSGTTVFLYDGSTVIGEASTTGTMQVYYTPGVDYRRVSPTVAGNIYRENGIGSVVQLMNGSSAPDRYEYDAYGVTYTLSNILTNNIKFAGMHGYYTDGDSGMQLLGHRYYLPSLGRFLTQDPLGHEASEAQADVSKAVGSSFNFILALAHGGSAGHGAVFNSGLNLYQYAANNPIRWIDPAGLQIDSIRSQQGIQTMAEMAREGLLEEGVGTVRMAAIRQGIIQFARRRGILLTAHAARRAWERLQDLPAIQTIYQNGGGYYNALTRSYILYSNRLQQGMVIDPKTKEMVTILNRAARPDHWIPIGRGFLDK